MEYVSAYTVGASSSNRRTVRRHTTNVCVILDILASSALRMLTIALQTLVEMAELALTVPIRFTAFVPKDTMGQLVSEILTIVPTTLAKTTGRVWTWWQILSAVAETVGRDALAPIAWLTVKTVTILVSMEPLALNINLINQTLDLLAVVPSDGEDLFVI